MAQRILFCLCFLSTTLMGSVKGAPEEIMLTVIRFPEDRTVKVDMMPTNRIRDARMRAEVEYEQGQARIKIDYERMKPAVLFGGEVTSYVLWAINRDGASQNLGELWVRPEDSSDNLEFSTGLRNFALLLTAEAFYQADRPSEIVIFFNGPRPDPPVMTDNLTYSSLVPAPPHGIENLDTVQYDGTKPLDLVQAERVYETAVQLGAREYAPEVFSDATIALEQATLMVNRRVEEGAQRFARRSVTASNEAIRLTLRKKEFEELERLIAERQSQMASLEDRAARSEARAEEAEQSLVQVREEREQAQQAIQVATRQLEQVEQEQQRVQAEKSNLETEMSQLREERQQLMSSMENLQNEKSVLQDRLQGALSEVADTRESARGLIVSLPDILFDVGQATLKPQAQMVLAKLAGILLIMNDLNLRIEGHTDSTGSASFNLRLSQQRADSVFDFLVGQGIQSTRMTTQGYGMDRPVSSNSTAEGRRQNRRVEIIIGEGTIREQ